MNIFSSWLDAHFSEVNPFDFYRTIFPPGELEKKGEYTSGKYNGIIVEVTNQKKYTGKVKVKRYTLSDGLEALEEATESDNFCLCSPLSYAGKNRTAENARFLYAVAIDLDRIRTKGKEPEGLRVLWHQVNTKNEYTGRNLLPRPTFIVSSGTGLHLYFVLKEPVPLYREFSMELQELKRELTRLVWNDYIVDIDSPHDIQQEGIYQGFRMPGTVTKNGGRARAFKTGETVTLDYLNGFMPPESKAKRAAAAKRRGKLTLEEAKKKYPDWYDRRITRQEKRGTWHISRRLYDWWRGKILSGATVGHRYYCVMMLAIYAQKCSYYDAKHNPNPVTLKELERDAYSLVEPMEKLTDSDDNHFGLDDVQDALEAFQDRWTIYPRAAVEYRTAIPMPENKRNGRKQEEHIKLMNYIRDELNGNNTWNREGNGRKSQFETVQEWRREHPTGRKADCIKDTGLSKPTVYKHWSAEAAAAQAAAEAERKQAAAEARRLEELGQEARRLSQTIKEQIAAGEAVAQKMAERLEKMPEGEEKERYKKEYREALEGLQGIKNMMLPE